MDETRFQYLLSLALDRVAKECDNRSLFNLALSLHDTKAFFKLKKRPIQSIAINLKRPFPQLQVSLERNELLIFHFAPMRLSNGSDKFQVGGMVAECSMNTPNTVEIFSDSFMTWCQRVANTLFHIFTPIRFSCIVSDQINVPRFMKSLNFSHLESFSFRSTYALRKEDFFLIWNTPRPSKFLYFESNNNVIQQQKRDLLANYPQLWISPGQWVTEEMLCS